MAAIYVCPATVLPRSTGLCAQSEMPLVMGLRQRRAEPAVGNVAGMQAVGPEPGLRAAVRPLSSPYPEVTHVDAHNM